MTIRNSLPIQIHTRPNITRILLALWIVLGLLAVAGIGIGITAFRKSEIMAAMLLLIGNGFLLISAIYFLSLFSRSLRAKSPVIEMTASHFYDKRISKQAIPWSGIQWRAVYAKSGSIQIDISDEYNHLLFNSVGDKFSANFCRLLGFPRYSVTPLATGNSIHELENLFNQFKPPLG